MSLPLPFKKIINIFRGEVAPILILLSTALGFWFGLTPGWYGIHVALLAVALVLNIHIGIFLIAAGVGKSLCYASAPLIFHIGAWVQESVSPLLRFLSAVPVVGITDFTRYSVAGAMLIGPVVGLLLGLLFSRSVVGFRKTWLKLEDNSEAFKTWRTKWWIKLLDRLLIGKSAKDVKAVLTRRPKIIRIPGIIIAVLLVGGFAVAINLLQKDVTADYAARSLTEFNGAEVNLDKLELDALAGSIHAAGIQVTDPDKPQNNTIAIGTLSASASLWDLSTGRVVIDNISMADVTFDSPRQIPGKVIAKTEEEETEPFDPSKYELPDLDLARLESYFKNAQAIKDQLKQISQWLPPGQEDGMPTSTETPVPEHYLAFLTARAQLPQTPRIIIKQIQLDKVSIPVEQFGSSKISCLNISEAPEAAGLPIIISVESNDKPTSLEIISHYDSSQGGATIKAGFADVDLKQLQTKLSDKNPVSFQGGIASGSIEGRATRHTIDLAIKTKIQNLQAGSVGGGLLGLDPQVSAEAMKVLNNFETTLRLVGPITEPRLVFDGPALRKEFRDALVRAGKDQLAKHITGLTGVDGAKLLDQPLDAGKDIADTFLGGKSKKKDEKEKKKTDDPFMKLKDQFKKK